MEDYLNLAAQIIYGKTKNHVEPVCMEDGCDEILCEAEEEEGRCARCSEINELDTMMTAEDARRS